MYQNVSPTKKEAIQQNYYSGTRKKKNDGDGGPFLLLDYSLVFIVQ
jgi:hypothetical protein